MNRRLPIGILSLAAILTVATSGCAAFRGCGAADCQRDKQITSDVQASLDRHPEFDPHTLTVQTNDQVTYLYGMVATDLQRNAAEIVAYQVPGVAMVVNGIVVTEK
jgi:osmotically-inducible protein OsmY